MAIAATVSKRICTMLDSSTPSASERHAIAPAGRSPWSDLDSDLLVSIATRVSLTDYASLRRVCTAWRSALALATYPRLLSLADDHGRHIASLVCLPMRRPFHIHTVYPALHDTDPALYDTDDRHPPLVHCSVRVVGSGNGRFALAVDQRHRAQHGRGRVLPSVSRRRMIFLIDPRSGEEVVLVDPTRDYDDECVQKVVFAPKPNHDWTIVALYNKHQVAYIHGKVDNKWKTVDIVTHTDCLLDMAYDPDGGDNVYLLDSRGGMHVLRVPRGGHNNMEPAMVGRLVTLVLKADPTDSYAPPYNVASSVMITKHIFFCHGSLYQVWKNTSANFNSGRNHFRMSRGEILVLRYDPGRWPCWDVVKDLGGCSVFVSKISNPRVAQAAALPGVRANSVYWIDLMGVPMVCDMSTGISEPCVLPYGTCKGDCWYFNNDGPVSTTVLMHKKLKLPRLDKLSF